MAENHEDSTLEKLKRYSAIGFVVAVFASALIWHFVSTAAGILAFLVGIVISVVPISVYQYMEYNRYTKMEEHFPNFLEDFAEAKKTGMTFPQAFMSISKADYGSLSKEVKKSANHLSWNVPFPKVMDYLAQRTSRSKLIHQAFTIINEAYNSGGNVAETMSTLAMNITRIKQIEDERRSIMSQQVFVIYFIFILFIGILIGLYQVLIPMTDLGGDESSGLNETGAFKGSSILGKPIDYCATVSQICDFGNAMGFQGRSVYFKSLFFLMSLIQALSSGIVAGQIGEGTFIAGVRHAGIMVTATVLSFVIFFA